MIIHTVGCSFTYAGQRGWPTMLSNAISQKTGIKTKLINSGHPGAGNSYIANKIMLESHDIYNKPDLAVIMWSGLTRKDVSVDHTDKLVMGALEGYHDYVRWSGRHTSYILSGGIKGSWEWHPATREIFAPLYKYSNERTMAQDTLVNMISAQNYLKQLDIPYIMSSYMNYWTDEGQVGELDYGIAKFPDLQYLVDQIDFSKWMFINDRKDGIYELAKATPDGLQEDGFHPDFNVHQMWADALMAKLEADNFLHN